MGVGKENMINSKQTFLASSLQMIPLSSIFTPLEKELFLWRTHIYTEKSPPVTPHQKKIKVAFKTKEVHHIIKY